MGRIRHKKRYFSYGMDEPGFRKWYRSFVNGFVGESAKENVYISLMFLGASLGVAIALLLLILIGGDILGLLSKGQAMWTVKEHFSFFVNNFSKAFVGGVVVMLVYACENFVSTIVNLLKLTIVLCAIAIAIGSLLQNPSV